MRKAHWVFLIGSSPFLAIVLIAGPQQSKGKRAEAPTAKPVAAARPPAARSAAPGFAPVASIQEIMSAIVDPTSKVLFSAVSVETTQAGTKTKAPETAADWAVVRRNALMLVEVGNLLKISGRRVEPA